MHHGAYRFVRRILCIEASNHGKNDYPIMSKVTLVFEYELPLYVTMVRVRVLMVLVRVKSCSKINVSLGVTVCAPMTSEFAVAKWITKK